MYKSERDNKIDVIDELKLKSRLNNLGVSSLEDFKHIDVSSSEHYKLNLPDNNFFNLLFWDNLEIRLLKTGYEKKVKNVLKVGKECKKHKGHIYFGNECQKCVSERVLKCINNKNKEDKKLYDISMGVRQLIYSSFKKNKYVNSKKHMKTEDIIGCTFIEFKEHISKQFVKGMSWYNYGEWHLDHIQPISLAMNRNEIYKLNRFENFQPLWKYENIRKKDYLPLVCPLY